MTTTQVEYDDDVGYRNSILSYMMIPEYDEQTIMEKTHQLFEKVKDIPEFQEKMRTAATSMGLEELEMGLIILFSYDHFAEFGILLNKYEITIE